LGQGGQVNARDRKFSGSIRIPDVGENETPAREYLRELFFDDQGTSQEGQPCQLKFRSRFKALCWSIIFR
jgi:hypothetical protein